MAYRKLMLIAAAAGVLAALAPAYAHHSYAMFDREKTVTLEGTVRTWEMGNPHAYLWLYVKDKKGNQNIWGLEGPSPNILIKNGWGKNSVKAGDKVTVLANPLRDGRNGGNLITMTLADGRSFTGTRIPGSAPIGGAGGAGKPAKPNGAD